VGVDFSTYIYIPEIDARPARGGEEGAKYKGSGVLRGAQKY
jgi:hypothetical protein